MVLARNLGADGCVDGVCSAVFIGFGGAVEVLFLVEWLVLVIVGL